MFFRPSTRHMCYSTVYILHGGYIVHLSRVKVLQVRASSYIQMNQPTRCSSFTGLLLVF